MHVATVQNQTDARVAPMRSASAATGGPTSRSSALSKSKADWNFLPVLKEAGRVHAADWLKTPLWVHRLPFNDRHRG
jgi:hypothetical protein